MKARNFFSSSKTFGEERIFSVKSKHCEKNAGPFMLNK